VPAGFYYLRGGAAARMVEVGPPVRDMDIREGASPAAIIGEMGGAGGFEATGMAAGLDILHAMAADPDCLRFLSFVGATVSTGLRGVLRDMARRKMFDVIVTTCGALDHDLARSFADYNAGSFTMDDGELAGQDIHRLGSVLVPSSSYGTLIEEKMQGILGAMHASGARTVSTADIARAIGERTGEGSFLHWAAKNSIPVIVPGIMDGAVGSQVWMFCQGHPGFSLDIVRDSEALSGLVFGAKRSGALMLGGGISKHHTLWWNQYRGGLDYALYVTTAGEHDGSLSGAPVREAVSWGKVARGARQATLHAEATVALPFLYAALLERLAARPDA